MRANRHGKGYVYTERGPDVFRKEPPRPFIVKPDDENVPSVSTPSSVVLSPPQPEPICPHNGIYFGGVAICGECLRDRRGKGVDEKQLAQETENLFGLAVLHTCNRVARKNLVRSVPLDDCVMTAALALVNPKSKKQILTAKNPEAMAYTIAKRAIQKLYRGGKSVKSLAVSQIAVANDEGQDLSVSDAIGLLAEPQWQKGDRAAFNSVKMTRKVYDAWAERCYERVRVFPGIKLLWTDENLNRLRMVLDEAKKLLPTRPFSHWIVISMKIGYDMPAHTWSQIAEQVSPSWKRLTERQVQYAYNEGLKMMKTHLLSKLLPVPEKASNGNSMT